MDRPQVQVAGYVSRLRRRALGLLAVRGLCSACGVGVATLALTGALVGPVATPATAAAALVGLALLALATAAAAMSPALRFRGADACRLLTTTDPALASSARSVLELSDDSGVGASAALVAAHAASVQATLDGVSRAEVVPLTWLRHRSMALAVAAAVIGVSALATSERARDGALALLHPATLRADGMRTAAIVDTVRARTVFPSYLDRAPREAPLKALLSVPRGTTVELTVVPRLPSMAGRLRVAGTDVRLEPTPRGELFGRFVARQDGPLEIRLQGDDGWYVDDTARRLRAVPDRAPEITIQQPGARSVSRLEQPIPLSFTAKDDGGIAAVELAVRMPDGEERRRRLWSSVGKGTRPELSHSTELLAAELGAQDGDVLLMWLEATDADVVSGPNVGHSATVTLEIASAAQELSLHIPRLQAALDEGIAILGDRLELPLPEPLRLAQQRFDELEEKTTAWLTGLGVLIDEASDDDHPPGLDLDQLQGIVDRTGKLLRGEEALYRRGAAGRPRWSAADGRMIEEHERDVLLLADLFAQALVDEARALTDELSGLRDEIRQLLDEVKKAGSEDAKRALLSRIAKAQRRLQDLAASLSRLATRVPSEFINREALPRESAAASLDDLRQAVEDDDLESALAHLEELAKQIDGLAEQIDSGGARFREAHFGSHDAALAQAQNEVSVLAEEQRRLAGRTGDLLRQASRRAQQSGEDPETDALQEQAKALERRLGELDQGTMGSAEGKLLDRARDRLRDSRDALRTGDLSEARRMAGAAQRSVEQAAQSLGADARMFPGHDGSTWRNAEQVAEAARSLQQLESDIGRAGPHGRDFLSESERNRMRSDVQPQRAARERARALSEKLGEGKRDLPLSPRGESELAEVERAMERAERALDHGEAQDAALAQEDARERLDQLAEDLAEQSRGRGSRREAGEGDGGSAGQRVTGHVRIPGADEAGGPVEMRRRLLDAMREEAPPGFQGSVDRYYMELLK